MEMEPAPTQFPQAGSGSLSQGRSKRGRWGSQRWAHRLTGPLKLQILERDADISPAFLWSRC